MLILYNPPSSSERKPVLPMSLLALGALLEGKHDYLIIDGNLEPDPLESIDRAIRDTGADVLAVTVMPGPQLSHAVPQCRHLRERHPDLTIIWGGYFPTQRVSKSELDPGAGSNPAVAAFPEYNSHRSRRNLGHLPHFSED